MVIRIKRTRLRLFLTRTIWLLGAIWFISQLPEWWQQGRELADFPFEPLLAFFVGLIPLIDFRGDDAKDTDSYDFASPQHKQNHDNITANVKSAYIDGVLNHALHKVVRIKLNLEDMPEALQRPLVLYEGQEYKQPIAKGTSIYDVFVDSGSTMLILGAPGSGKTITLLELCKTLIRKAENEVQEPVPVVLNLSTWAEKQGTLADWIVYEMNRQYQLSTKVAPAWLAKDHLCLLLDGLDEVRPDVRDQCVQAINDFKKTHDAPLVVCSRIADYEELCRTPKSFQSNYNSTAGGGANTGLSDRQAVKAEGSV